MKRIAFMSMVIVAVLSAGPLLAVDYKGPRIEVKELRHDLGKIVEGTPAVYVFEVRNAGSEQLVLEKIQSS